MLRPARRHVDCDNVFLAASAAVFAIFFGEADPPLLIAEVKRVGLNALRKCVVIAGFDLVTLQPYFVDA